MKRDIANIKRNLENKRANDIIYKKNKLMEMFENDPDILEVLGRKEPHPLNRYNNPGAPTEEELKKREEIVLYNKKIQKKQIVPFLKINGIQDEVLNFLMFDIEDSDVSYSNDIIKKQNLLIMCTIHEDDMYTQYGILRTDLLDYIIRDLLCWSNFLGMKLKLTNDYTDIIDAKYYARIMKFTMQEANVVNGHMGMHNRYDKNV